MKTLEKTIASIALQIETQRAKRTIKKVIRLTNTTDFHVHHTFWYISLPALHDYDVKFPYMTFCAWSPEPREGLAACSAQGGTFIFQLFLDPEYWSGPGNRTRDLPLFSQVLYRLS